MSEKRVILAEYFVTDDMILLFVLGADFKSPNLVILPLDQNQLNDLRRFIITNFGEHNRVRIAAKDLEAFWHRYDCLIEPFSQWAEPEDIICLIPHDLLHYLPLHALRLGGQYLIERNPVLYSPSATVLMYCQAKRKYNADGTPARRTVAIFGDSRGDLRSARNEAEALAQQFGVDPVLGQSVTRESVLQAIAGTDIIHFAGHGYFDAEHALESSLRLAGAEVLTAREIFALEGVDASLVTLSGCETAVNENRPGDELQGLTRAFLYAGTPSVLVSLWRVADASTAFLMKQFYTYLRGDLTILKVDALRKAMLDTKVQPGWASFYHWAPFILVGDWL